MKSSYLLSIILVFVFISCESKHEMYSSKFNAYTDTFYIYLKKSDCFKLCGQNDSSSIWWGQALIKSNIADSFYKLTYPNGNPCCKVDTSKNKCNCK